MTVNICKILFRNANLKMLIVPASLVLFACEDPEAAKRAEALAAGEAVVKKTCFVCHGQGINGAPIIGNAKMWGPRIEKGKDALLFSALNGKGDMPIKGGNLDLSDDDISLAIDYMISQIQ